MKKLTSVFLALALALSLCVPAFAANNGTVTITSASVTKNTLTVQGRVTGGTRDTVAVAVQLLSGNEILAMESLRAENGDFSGVISGLSLTPGSSYTLRIADYDGGAWTINTVTVPADVIFTPDDSTGGSSSSTTTNPDGSTTSTVRSPWGSSLCFRL